MKRVICAALVITFVCSQKTYCADDVNQVTLQASHNLFFESAKKDLKTLPDEIFQNTKNIFSNRYNILALMGAGAASIAMNQHADKNIDREIEKTNCLNNFNSESLNILGGPIFHFSAAGLWYAISVQNRDELNRDRAATMFNALATTGLYTVILKVARDNDSPNGDRWAWPSGHTSSSFTVASVLDEYYGPCVGIPAYAGASLVGYRMMAEGEHWASDVVFGAVLGWVVGHTVAGNHKNMEVGGFTVQPFLANSQGAATGISLVKKF